jgi:hypothetical protein
MNETNHSTDPTKEHQTLQLGAKDGEKPGEGAQTSPSKPEPLEIRVLVRLANLIERCFPIDPHKTTALFTGLIFIATMIYAVFSIALWKTNDELSQTTRESLDSVQRAFITFDAVALDTYPKAVGPGVSGVGRDVWAFTGRYSNSGTTPAIDKLQYFDCSNELSDEPSEEKFIGNDADRPIGEVGSKAQKYMGPLLRQSDFILGPYSLSDIGTTEFDKFFKSRRIFFWGWVGYKDVFWPHSSPHVTEFCVEAKGVEAMVISNGKTKTLAPKLHFKECAQHNCTDEHCKDYENIARLIP